jgi:hypothetical protein
MEVVLMDERLNKNLIYKQDKGEIVKESRTLGIGFYNMDIETAKLHFRVIDDNKPLLLGQRNVTCFAFLQSSNGSNSGVLNLEYEDPMKGILCLTVPKDFLKDATNTKVTGQVYIAVNGRETTMALDEFEFEVRDALINKITGEEKVKTIRMFYELREFVENQVKDLTGKISDINQLVDNKMTEFDTTFEENSKKLQEAFDNYNKSLNDDYKALDENVKLQKEKIDELYQQSFTSMEDNKTQFVNDLNSLTSETKAKIDDMTAAMQKNIEESQGITRDDIVANISANNDDLKWQKYKLTEDSGDRIYLGELKQRVESLSPGIYECIVPADAETVNAPKDKNSSAYIAEINVYSGKNGRKQILLIQNYAQSVWVKTLHTDGVDMGWKPLAQQSYDSNWQKVTLKNGAMELGGSNPVSQYRVIEENGIRKAYIRLYLKNIIDGTVVASFPPEIVSGPHFLNCVAKISKDTPRVTINSTGDIIFYKNKNDSWNETDYIIVEDSWLIS